MEIINFKLFLMRHGEAESRISDDFSRALTPNGILESKDAGKWVAQQNTTIDLVLCSEAVRTRQTLEKAMESFSTRHILFDKKIYLAQDIQNLRNTMLDNIDNLSKSILVVGHNPTITLFATFLTCSPISLSPADCVSLSLNSETWDEALHSEGLWTINGLHHK